MREVDVAPVSLDRLAALLPPDRMDRLAENASRARSGLGQRVVWHVNATASGGGVAELLQTLLAYAKGARVENRWLVLDADHEFFTITKRLHNLLHGQPGDGGPLTDREHAHYRAVLAANTATLRERVSPQDIVVLHDPQTAGLVRDLRETGTRVVWRCHVGRDERNGATDIGWDFLRGYVEEADAFVFSRDVYAPPWVDRSRLWVIPPSIDPLSAKNVQLEARETRSVLVRAGLWGEPDLEPGLKTGRDGGPLAPGQRFVLQVSRWDRLKDMPGVMAGFAMLAEDRLPVGAHLVLAGPQTSGVGDDPEGADVLADCQRLRTELHPATRARVHLFTLPMDDLQENALIVNALQRRAAVVVQKSLAEGFGLTVTEAMWKGRPVVASRVGGIQDQIIHGRDGLLLDDPSDLPAFAGTLRTVLEDTRLAGRLGRAARARVLDEYVGDRHLERYVDLFVSLVDGAGPRPSAAG